MFRPDADVSEDRSPPLSPSGSWRTAAGNSANVRRGILRTASDSGRLGVSSRLASPRANVNFNARRDSAATQPPSDEDDAAFPMHMIDGITTVPDNEVVSSLQSPTSARQPRPSRAARRFLTNTDTGSPVMSRAASYANMAQFPSADLMVLTDDDEEMEHVTHVEDRKYAHQAVAARREADILRRAAAPVDITLAVPPAQTPPMAPTSVVGGNNSFVGGNNSFVALNASIVGGNSSWAPGNHSFAGLATSNDAPGSTTLPGQIITSPLQTPSAAPAAPPLEELPSLLPMPAGSRADLFHQLPPDVTPPQTALFIQRRAHLMHHLNSMHAGTTSTSGSPQTTRPVPAMTPPPMPLARSGSNSHVNSARTQPLSTFNTLPPEDSPRRPPNATTVERPSYFHPSASYMANSLMSEVDSERQDKVSVGGDGTSLRVVNSFARRRVASPVKSRRDATPPVHLMMLPNDTLIWIVTGFLSSPCHPNVRLVCRRFNSIVTSACVVWYRRVPHTIFIAHLTHRIRQETDAVKKAQERSMELAKKGYIDPTRFQHRIAARNGDDSEVATEPAVSLPPDMNPDTMLAVPMEMGNSSGLPPSATANINLWLEEEQEAGGVLADDAEEDEEALRAGLCDQLLSCHTFNDMMGNQLQFLFNTQAVDTPDDRDRWFLQTCVKGCCHREWVAFLAACHEKDQHVSRLQEHARVGGAICRAFMFPASRVPAIVIALIVTTYLCLIFFALMAWAGISSPAIQFGPLWAFFILLFPLLYIFFGASTIEPMVLSFLGFVGFTFSAVLVYFYRVVSPFKAMSWISCATPLLLCMSCCATYSFLMLHRLSEEVTVVKHRLVTLAACSLPAVVLLFATLVALELDGTVVVYVPGYGPPVATTQTTAPGQQQSAAPDQGWSAANTGLDGNLNCGGTLRFSGLAAAIAMVLLAWVSSVALHTFPFASMHAKLPATSTSLLCFHVAFITGMLASVSGFMQDAACYPSVITFAFAMLSLISLCVAQCFSVVSSTALKEHTLVPGLVDMDLLTLVDTSGVDVAFSTQEVAALLSPNHEDPAAGADSSSVIPP